MNPATNNILDNARIGLSKGVHTCADAVRGTIGGAGKNVIIRKDLYPYYISTKDAFSIIQATHCEDPLEKQAVDMMRDATDSMNKIAKDGRTAMCILTDAILQETEKQQADPMQVEKEINELLPFIEKSIDEQTRQVDVKDIEAVARTASNSDRIAKIIGEVYQTQGKDCIINHIESSGTLKDYVLYHDGVRFQGTGFLTDSFVHDEEAKKDKRSEKRAVYENPMILVTKRKITKESDIDPYLLMFKRLTQGVNDKLFKELFPKGDPNTLIIFTDDMGETVATELVKLHKSGTMNICIVKAPVLWKEYVFEDFAKCVGATIVEDATGVDFKNLALSHLGTCDKIVIDKEETIINGTADLTEHLQNLKEKGDDDSMRRVWWLTTKTATIRLGATNEGELSNLRLACTDAVFSCQAALQSGVCAGAGVCLFNVAQHTLTPLLQAVLRAPLLQILKNGGIDLSKRTEFEIGDELGYDTKNNKPVNVFEAGIVDSALVVKNSIRNSIGIASIILKTDKLIDLPHKSFEDKQLELLSSKRSPF